MTELEYLASDPEWDDFLNQQADVGDMLLKESGLDEAEPYKFACDQSAHAEPKVIRAFIHYDARRDRWVVVRDGAEFDLDFRSYAQAEWFVWIIWDLESSE